MKKEAVKPKFYVTTPIYYVNDLPHIGHAYTTIAADVLARYKRLMGFEVFFLTGTDEHGMKIAESALKAGKKPAEFTNEVVEKFKKAWEVLNISYDDFIRTTEERHKTVVENIFQKLYEKGDIYKGVYEGWYCTPCESYWTELQLKKDPAGKYLCPDCGREVERIKEESYFFALSRYQEKLLKHLKGYPEFIRPQSRYNEVLNFISQGLKDLSVTRKKLKWGIPSPVDSEHVIYVWFDALINYVTAAGCFLNEERFQCYWPADVHIMGKEIVRFHAVIWPAILMALGIFPPQKIFGHGWWTVEGEKMSKSKGNAIDPVEISDEFSADVLRYFILREVPFGMDGNFSRKELVRRYNSDLANDLGNLLNRTLTMVEKYFEGRVPTKPLKYKNEIDIDLVSLAQNTPNEFNQKMEQLAFSEALFTIWQLISKANHYIEKRAPWTLSKEGKVEDLEAVIYNLLEVLRIVAILVSPFMPETSERIWQQLGIDAPLKSILAPDLLWGRTLNGTQVMKGKPLFPRLEIKNY